MYSLVQHICSFGPPLGRAVQEASVIVIIHFSQSVPGGRGISGKFNFGLGMGWGLTEWGWNIGSGLIPVSPG